MRRRGALADREQLLLCLATAANQVSGTKAKLVALADTAVPALSDVCAINLLDGPLAPGVTPTAPIPTWRITAPTSPGVIGPPPGRPSLWTGGDPASAAVAAGRTVVFHYDADRPPPWAAAAGVHGAIRDGRVHCTAMVPVIVDGLVHAVMAFGAGPGRAAYGNDDLELFELIADQTAGRDAPGRPLRHRPQHRPHPAARHAHCSAARRRPRHRRALPPRRTRRGRRRLVRRVPPRHRRDRPGR
ncbi:GAF domain-containing protein [Pseudonocardia ailaonensis]|uniref:GAF domain-containing protein n=1 Tax=Pseudonocardia ailaonensis TaxID=367279 RepID=UPI003CD09692